MQATFDAHGKQDAREGEGALWVVLHRLSLHHLGL